MICAPREISSSFSLVKLMILCQKIRNSLFLFLLEGKQWKQNWGKSVAFSPTEKRFSLQNSRLSSFLASGTFRRGEMSLMGGTVSPTLPQSLHRHDVYQRGRKQAKTKKSLWTWILLSGIFNNMKVRQHLTKWVSWNNCHENWNNSNSLFYATLSLPSLSSDLKVSIINKLNFYGKERFFTETINSSVWIGKIQKN